MKKLIPIIIVSILCFQITYAQSGEITYKNEPMPPEGLEEMKKTDPQKYKRYSFMINKIKARTKRLRYTLEFNNSQSVFNTNPSMTKEDNPMAGMSTSKREHYYHLASSERYVKSDVGGKEMLVNKAPIDWIISKETKVINGYSSRKAEATQMFYSVDRESGKLKTKEQHITAWFTTEIPFSFGPENYGGLPGLVLELSTQGKNYTVESIKLKENKNKTIDFPDLDKAISEQEAAQQMNKAMSNMFGG
ncbi:GLPGLI family protein [Psychroflexus lacisalsi]|jgi:GLPGLI family protein|uniref:GLPGLI family protein n=1 Tax=Psychroflexus lacisalsi TaxID=503928 RepID=A0ABN1K0S8_9FLAO|nr:GLPGLI family protein [Psychroflexus lacisalsi]MBZ9620707.1 GLPGLI family protein [Psychroflexus lacisalsi]